MRVSTDLEPKKFRKIFELYQVLIHNSLCHNVGVIPNYTLLTGRINKFWDQRFWTESSLYLYQNVPKSQTAYYPQAIKAFLSLLNFISKNSIYFFFLIFWQAPIPPYCWMPCYKRYSLLGSFSYTLWFPNLSRRARSMAWIMFSGSSS